MILAIAKLREAAVLTTSEQLEIRLLHAGLECYSQSFATIYYSLTPSKLVASCASVVKLRVGVSADCSSEVCISSGQETSLSRHMISHLAAE